MLAEVLERSRDQVVDELERRAAVIESTELSGVGRRNRLGAFVDELIGALCRGHTHEPTGAAPAIRSTNRCSNFANASWCGATSSNKIEQQEVVASPSETAVVAEWAGHADRKRLREQNRQLCALLDAVQESAAVFGPDGRDPVLQPARVAEPA